MNPFSFLCCLFVDILFDILEEGGTSFTFYLSVDELKSFLEDEKSLVYSLIVDDDRRFDTDSLSAIECTSDEYASFEEFRCDLVANLF